MGSSRRDQVALEKKKWEAEQQRERMGGRYVGNASGGFIPASGLEARRISDSAMKQAAMADRGLTNRTAMTEKGLSDRNKYSKDAESVWRGREQAGLTNRVNIQEQGLTNRNIYSKEAEKDWRANELRSLENRNKYSSDSTFASRLNEESGLNKRAMGLRDAERRQNELEQRNKVMQFFIESGMTPAEAASQFKHVQRYLEEGGKIEDIIPTIDRISGQGGVSPVVEQNNASNAFNRVGTNINSPRKMQDTQPYQYPTGANMQGIGQYGYPQQGGVSPAIETGLQYAGRGINKTLDFASRVSNANSAANKLKAYQQLQGALHSNRWDR